MSEASNAAAIAAEVNYTPCDLAIVRADSGTYVVDLQRDIARLGDRVDFIVKDAGLICGFVEDILRCGRLDDTYCFIGTATTIHKPSGVYSRVWACKQLRDSLLL